EARHSRHDQEAKAFRLIAARKNWPPLRRASHQGAIRLPRRRLIAHVRPSPSMPAKNKLFDSIDAAVADVPDGATIMFGGFGGAGFPNNLIQGLARQGPRSLEVIRNN